MRVYLPYEYARKLKLIQDHVESTSGVTTTRSAVLSGCIAAVYDLTCNRRKEIINDN